MLTFTQKEISKSLLIGLINKQKSFTLTHLVNRDAIVENIEKLLEDRKQTYQVENGHSKVTKGVVGYLLGGAVGGLVGSVTGGLLGYFADFTDDTQWLILESPDSRILDVLSVRDLKNKDKEK